MEAAPGYPPYLINKESVEKRIEDLKRVPIRQLPVMSSRDETQRVETSHDASKRDTSRHDEYLSSEDARELRVKLQTLEVELRVQKEFTQRVAVQNDKLIEKMVEQGRQIGTLQAQLALSAPKGAPTESVPPEPRPQYAANEVSAYQPPPAPPTAEHVERSTMPEPPPKSHDFLDRQRWPSVDNSHPETKQ